METPAAGERFFYEYLGITKGETAPKRPPQAKILAILGITKGGKLQKQYQNLSELKWVIFRGNLLKDPIHCAAFFPYWYGLFFMDWEKNRIENQLAFRAEARKRVQSFFIGPV